MASNRQIRISSFRSKFPILKFIWKKSGISSIVRFFFQSLLQSFWTRFSRQRSLSFSPSSHSPSSPFKASKQNLQLKEERGRGVFVADVTEAYVSSPDEVFDLMRRGAANRVVSATSMEAFLCLYPLPPRIIKSNPSIYSSAPLHKIRNERGKFSQPQYLHGYPEPKGFEVLWSQDWKALSCGSGRIRKSQEDAGLGSAARGSEKHQQIAFFPRKRNQCFDRWKIDSRSIQR